MKIPIMTKKPISEYGTTVDKIPKEEFIYYESKPIKIIVVGESGFGMSLLRHRMMDRLWEKRNCIITINDTKSELNRLKRREKNK